MSLHDHHVDSDTMLNPSLQLIGHGSFASVYVILASLVASKEVQSEADGPATSSPPAQSLLPSGIWIVRCVRHGQPLDQHVQHRVRPGISCGRRLNPFGQPENGEEIGVAQQDNPPYPSTGIYLVHHVGYGTTSSCLAVLGHLWQLAHFDTKYFLLHSGLMKACSLNPVRYPYMSLFMRPSMIPNYQILSVFLPLKQPIPPFMSQEDPVSSNGVECQRTEEAQCGTVEAWGDGIAIFICTLNWHDPSLFIGPNDSSGSSKFPIRESLFSATVRIVLVPFTTEIFGTIFVQGSLSGQTIARHEKIGLFLFYSAVEAYFGLQWLA
ncbi:hypothetical protein EV421DRAFT_1737194 [Armillaria borealis]|uniref:Uncharacterized protein n=1 Tax=Armillaria borealis TaxID=47425 RepID=A0AA39JDB6_9AGAR|nr:hypothetical protein EV421DRAFT_1737194 [Armillaria borealis]